MDDWFEDPFKDTYDRQDPYEDPFENPKSKCSECGNLEELCVCGTAEDN